VAVGVAGSAIRKGIPRPPVGGARKTMTNAAARVRAAVETTTTIGGAVAAVAAGTAIPRAMRRRLAVAVRTTMIAGGPARAGAMTTTIAEVIRARAVAPTRATAAGLAIPAAMPRLPGAVGKTVAERGC